MYLLCGYKISHDGDYPTVHIFGLYDTIDAAKDTQKNAFGCLEKINNCWRGKNGVITWIKKIEKGIQEKAINIRLTNEAY